MTPIAAGIILGSTGGVPGEFLFGGWPLFAVSALAVAWLGQHLLALRTPPGLTVTDAGLWGVRGSARVALSWIDLAGVSVVDAKGAKLGLQPRAAAPIVVEPRWTGSDPNLVAAIVGHYLASPADRPVLAHPCDAVRRIETAQG